MPEEQIIEELPAGPTEGGGGSRPWPHRPGVAELPAFPPMASAGRQPPSCSACAIGSMPWNPRPWRRSCMAVRLAAGTSHSLGVLPSCLPLKHSIGLALAVS